MANLLKCLIPTIGSPATLNGNEGRYELAAFYCELLGMTIVNEGWLLIAEGMPSKFFVALDGDGWSEQRPPRWPDPEYPQQMHLDILVPDVDTTGALATAAGATLLRANNDFRVYADPVGHPFCLYPEPSVEKPTVGRLVFDCYSPRAVASFYEAFLEARGRVEDVPERVVVDLGDDALPHLAFQHSQFRAARWPDPDYPAQLHVDYRWHDGITARLALERAERLGAIRLPQLAGAEIYADPASHPFCIQNEIPMVFDVVGLYLNPPEYAVVYVVDATGQAQPPTSNQLALLMTSGTPERRTPDEARRDVLDLFTTFDFADIVTGTPHRATEFERFLAGIESELPAHLDVNLVCDREGTYKSPAIQTWLADHPRVQVHFNPSDASWHGPAGRWFDFLTNELVRRGDHTSANTLEADVRSWAQAWNGDAQPFVWTRSN